MSYLLRLQKVGPNVFTIADQVYLETLVDLYPEYMDYALEAYQRILDKKRNELKEGELQEEDS